MVMQIMALMQTVMQDLAGKICPNTETQNCATCFIPQGILNIDVPIIVFQIMNLSQRENTKNNHKKTCIIFEANSNIQNVFQNRILQINKCKQNTSHTLLLYWNFCQNHQQSHQFCKRFPKDYTHRFLLEQEEHDQGPPKKRGEPIALVQTKSFNISISFALFGFTSLDVESVVAVILTIFRPSATSFDS